MLVEGDRIALAFEPQVAALDFGQAVIQRGDAALDLVEQGLLDEEVPLGGLASAFGPLACQTTSGGLEYQYPSGL